MLMDDLYIEINHFELKSPFSPVQRVGEQVLEAFAKFIKTCRFILVCLTVNLIFSQDYATQVTIYLVSNIKMPALVRTYIVRITDIFILTKI